MRAAVAGLALLALTLGAAPPTGDFHDPRPVAIAGYVGDAMEPFVSRDGRYLLFNNRNDPPEKTDLYWAERGPAGGFVFRGEIVGANSPALDAVPSLDDAGELYFVSTRSYGQTLSTLYRAHFAVGRATGVEIVPGVSPHIPGLVDFDAEISADGQSLYVAEGDFRGGGSLPKAAKIVRFERSGAGFRRDPRSDALLATVNAAGLDYAPDVSADGCELFFTRDIPGQPPAIYRAIRSGPGQPFGGIARVAAAEGFAEAPSLSGDGRTLYFHRQAVGRFQIWSAVR
jgi:hypothetical protein